MVRPSARAKFAILTAFDHLGATTPTWSCSAVERSRAMDRRCRSSSACCCTGRTPCLPRSSTCSVRAWPARYSTPCAHERLGVTDVTGAVCRLRLGALRLQVLRALAPRPLRPGARVYLRLGALGDEGPHLRQGTLLARPGGAARLRRRVSRGDQRACLRRGIRRRAG